MGILTRIRRAGGLGIGALLISAGPATAQTSDIPRATIRAGVVFVGTSDEGLWTPPPDRSLPQQPFQFGAAVGGTLGVELRPTVHLGIEALVMVAPATFTLEATNAAGVSASSGGDVGFRAGAMGINYHLTPRARVEVYVGGYLGRLFPGTVDVTLDSIAPTGPLRFEGGWIYGLRAGLDLRLSDSDWLLSLGLRSLDVKYRRQASALGPGETLVSSRWSDGVSNVSLELARRF